MSVDCTSWAWNLPITRQPELVVMLVIADMADENDFCWPSQKTIAIRARCSVRTVRTCLAAFEEAGYIQRDPTYKGPVRTSDNILLLRTGVPYDRDAAAEAFAKKHREERRRDRETRSPPPRRLPPDPPAPAARESTTEPTSLNLVDRRGRAKQNAAPADWAPKDAHREKVDAFGWPSGMLEEQAERFREWEFREPKTDFDLAFHRWLRTENDRLKGRSNVAGSGTAPRGGTTPRQDRLGAMQRGAMAAVDHFERNR